MSPDATEQYYELRDRVTKAESKIDELMRNRHVEGGKSGSMFGIPNPFIVYAILGATALGSGPEAIDLLLKVLLK